MPNFDELTLEENHELGRRYMRERDFFPAHEAWETAWKQARGTDDAEFFKGLSQMGAGYVHLHAGERARHRDVAAPSIAAASAGIPTDIEGSTRWRCGTSSRRTPPGSNGARWCPGDRRRRSIPPDV